MTQQPSGWYEDPHDPSLYRYWDGVVWTDRVAPKTMPICVAAISLKRSIASTRAMALRS